VTILCPQNYVFVENTHTLTQTGLFMTFSTTNTHIYTIELHV